jgi:hypothetical protein
MCVVFFFVSRISLSLLGRTELRLLLVLTIYTWLDMSCLIALAVDIHQLRHCGGD